MAIYPLPEEVFLIAGRDESDSLILESSDGSQWRSNPSKRRKKTERIELPPAEYDDLRVRVGLVRSTKAGNYPAVRITGSADIWKLMRPLSNEPQEVFSVVLLDRNNVVLGVVELFRGGISSAVIDPRLVFVPALLSGAGSMILVHNHPSGNAAPSSEDHALTDNLMKGAGLLNMTILDHVVIGTEGQFTSMADQGLL